MSATSGNLSIIVIGASGDLARKKIFPALFALHSQGLLPAHFNVFGFARTKMSDGEFRAKIGEFLTCRYVPRERCSDHMDDFLSRCHYAHGDYGSRESFLDLYEKMRPEERGATPDRIFYMAVPPSLFLQVSHALAGAGLVGCGIESPWTRVVVEKPFGKDRQSSDVLAEQIAKVFSEEQTFRIDHYLGKEVIENLMVLRFANLIFEPIWNRTYVKSIRIAWKEDIGIEGRGGYFDDYGIIRDVMENHLLQILALTLMEPPGDCSARKIRSAKDMLLRSIPALRLKDICIGQYGRSAPGRVPHPAYAEEESVPAGSITPTFAAAVLKADNDRWRGVPFMLSAGKGLNSRMTEIVVDFRPVPQSVFCSKGIAPEPNRLSIRVQPDESIRFRIVSKVPGLEMSVESRDLDMHYKDAFKENIPEAYENLLLDVVRGDKSLFIGRDELSTAWDVFTPVLHEIDGSRILPEIYPFGGIGPSGAKALADRYGIECD